MKRLWLLLLILIPVQVFSITNLKLNGSGSTTINSLPAKVVLTCNLAAQGNQAEIEIFFDLDMNGQLDMTDQIIDYLIITDGVNWIIDPNDPFEDIPGDENGRDGTIKVTMDIEDDIDFAAIGQFIFRVTDNDNSRADAFLNIDIPTTPPYITGKVTDENTGAPIPYTMVMADDETNTSGFVTMTDENGDYTLDVIPGTFDVYAFYTMNRTYQDSDTTSVTVGEGETKTADLKLKPFDGFVEGHIRKENGDPVQNAFLLASSTDYDSYFFNYFGFTDADGYYKIGVKPGEVVVSAPTYLQSEISEDLFIEPASDTVDVAQGQTVTVDFTAKEYSTFITGTCTVNGEPLAGVEITGVLMAILPTPPFLVMELYMTTSQSDGTYRLGVSQDSLSTLMADKDGYELDSPMFGYQDIQTPAGQTHSGYDFEFTGESYENFISGQVTYEGGGAASDVYVVAIDDVTDDETGYLITHTDASGNYRFDDLEQGEWKVGVFKAGYHSNPYMVIDYLSSGDSMENTDFVLVDGEVTGVEENKVFQAPVAFELDQNYPNPFNMNAGMDHTSIRFTLQQQKDVEMSVFNVQGQLVTRVNLGATPQGTHQIHWDGRDLSGNMVPSGTYFYRIQAGSQVLTKRMTIIR